MKKYTKYILYAGVAIVGFMVFRKFIPIGTRANTGATVDIPLSGEKYGYKTIVSHRGLERVRS